MVGGFYFIIGSMVDGGTYYLTVDEAMGQEISSRPVRIVGKVLPGSWIHKEGSRHHRFTLAGEQSQMEVIFSGPMPDTFTEGYEVTAEGVRGEVGLLRAREITAKCPSKYEGKSAKDHTGPIS